MHKTLSPERVLVNRHGQRACATTMHQLISDIYNKEGEIVGQGKFLGNAVRLDNGHVVYAQPDQMEALSPAIEAELQELEDKAIAELAAQRNLLGGLGVV